MKHLEIEIQRQEASAKHLDGVWFGLDSWWCGTHWHFRKSPVW